MAARLTFEAPGSQLCRWRLLLARDQVAVVQGEWRERRLRLKIRAALPRFVFGAKRHHLPADHAVGEIVLAGYKPNHAYAFDDRCAARVYATSKAVPSICRSSQNRTTSRGSRGSSSCFWISATRRLCRFSNRWYQARSYVPRTFREMNSTIAVRWTRAARPRLIS
jgi:predicted nucleotidyltransferase